jgi:lipoprotein NlpI
MEIAFMDRDYKQVIQQTDKMLTMPEGQSELKAYFAFAHYLASRRLGLKEANEKLKEIKTSLPENSWPFTVASYLDGSLPEKEFMDAATNNDQKTETNTYVGMMKLFEGKPKEAKVLFEWVVKNGNRGFIEYHYAVQELRDLHDEKS